MAEVPIVDFSILGTNNHCDIIQDLSKDLYESLSTTGFVYIKNHGIDENKIANVFKVTRAFFQLPNEIKSLSASAKQGSCKHGWVECELERSVKLSSEHLNPKKAADFKEFFNIEQPYNDHLPWPTSCCPVFKKTVQDFFNSCEELTLCILDLLSLGLGLKDREFFRKAHQNMSTDENPTSLRILRYPGVTHPLKEGQLRCGEHSDYGSITLLFQDDVGGLEVCNRSGHFVAARPINGTVLVNIGDLMQRWTNNKLISTRHRVVVPEEESLRSKERYSVAFFVNPNKDTVIECLDGSGNYPPIKSCVYLDQRIAATFY